MSEFKNIKAKNAKKIVGFVLKKKKIALFCLTGQNWMFREEAAEQGEGLAVTLVYQSYHRVKKPEKGRLHSIFVALKLRIRRKR